MRTSPHHQGELDTGMTAAFAAAVLAHPFGARGESHALLLADELSALLRHSNQIDLRAGLRRAVAAAWMQADALVLHTLRLLIAPPASPRPGLDLDIALPAVLGLIDETEAAIRLAREAPAPLDAPPADGPARLWAPLDADTTARAATHPPLRHMPLRAHLTDLAAVSLIERLRQRTGAADAAALELLLLQCMEGPFRGRLGWFDAVLLHVAWEVQESESLSSLIAAAPLHGLVLAAPTDADRVAALVREAKTIARAFRGAARALESARADADPPGEARYALADTLATARSALLRNVVAAYALPPEPAREIAQIIWTRAGALPTFARLLWTMSRNLARLLEDLLRLQRVHQIGGAAHAHFAQSFAQATEKVREGNFEAADRALDEVQAALLSGQPSGASPLDPRTLALAVAAHRGMLRTLTGHSGEAAHWHTRARQAAGADVSLAAPQLLCLLEALNAETAYVDDRAWLASAVETAQSVDERHLAALDPLDRAQMLVSLGRLAIRAGLASGEPHRLREGAAIIAKAIAEAGEEPPHALVAVWQLDRIEAELHAARHAADATALATIARSGSQALAAQPDTAPTVTGALLADVVAQAWSATLAGDAKPAHHQEAAAAIERAARDFEVLGLATEATAARARWLELALKDLEPGDERALGRTEDMIAALRAKALETSTSERDGAAIAARIAALLVTAASQRIQLAQDDQAGDHLLRADAALHLAEIVDPAAGSGHAFTEAVAELRKALQRYCEQTLSRRHLTIALEHLDREIALNPAPQGSVAWADQMWRRATLLLGSGRVQSDVDLMRQALAGLEATEKVLAKARPLWRHLYCLRSIGVARREIAIIERDDAGLQVALDTLQQVDGIAVSKELTAISRLVRREIKVTEARLRRLQAS